MKKIRISIIGNYPPRQCGIATFTRHLTQGILNSSGGKQNMNVDAYIVAMNDKEYHYPEEVRYTIHQGHQKDYLMAAKFINHSNADVCILEHEFGIFGGADGAYILSLAHRLEIPLIVTLHTVLKEPSYTQKIIIRELAQRAEKTVVMSNLAVDFLTAVYDIPLEKIMMIEHGVPDFSRTERGISKDRFQFTGRKVLMTFGLISRNKGIETVIEALPEVVERHPDVLYVILGKTHPNLVEASGEEYRVYLKRLVDRYHLRNNVEFLDMFVSEERLKEYLSATDIYITPHLNKAQSTSGTLAYAVGAGAAVVSTPYWHAKELLGQGRGVLFDFKDSRMLARILNDLLDNHSKLNELRNSAYNHGRQMIWPEIGARYRDLAIELAKSGPAAPKRIQYIVDAQMLPNFDLTYVKSICDYTGIIQHAKHSVANLKEGYCLDDNARALLMASMAYRQRKDQLILSLIPRFMSFMHYMQNDDGTFRNLLSFDRKFLDKRGSEDSFGRAIWALGYQIRFPARDDYSQAAKYMFMKSLPRVKEIKSIRGISNTMIGISHYLLRYPEDDGMRNLLKRMTDRLVSAYNETKDEDWRWVETSLTYDNGIIPLSLFYAYHALEEKGFLRIAEDTCRFLEGVLFENGCLSLVGNAGWYKKGGEKAMFDQQPVDAMSAVLMFRKAYLLTGNSDYLERMFTSFKWFFGENDLGMPLYDFETGGCHDALSGSGINMNQGAESTLSYLISHLTVLDAHNEERHHGHYQKI